MAVKERRDHSHLTRSGRVSNSRSRSSGASHTLSRIATGTVLNRGRIRFAERRPVIAEDLAQTRPELGHATNAICHVGRRSGPAGCSSTAGLPDLLRPDPDDADGTILCADPGRRLPVCGGINLEYYFSYVDPPATGAGRSCRTTSLAARRDGRGGQRPADRAAVADGRDPRAGPAVDRLRDHAAIMLKVLEGNPRGQDHDRQRLGPARWSVPGHERDLPLR